MLVRSTIDGDTVVLQDGRHLRLIGLNALELGKHGEPDQPYAFAARRRLSELVSAGPITFVPGQEAFDRYGRSLGDLYASDGTLLASVLVREGLALAIAVPPNTDRYDCLAAAEGEARAAHRGLWTDPDAWTTDATQAPAHLVGFARVTGTIASRRERRSGTTLTFGDHLELWVPSEHRAELAETLARLVPGARLTVRGWWSTYRGHPSLKVDHASMVERAP